jgi:hypothetical protein
MEDLSSDFKPVRPLAHPRLRALWITPVWLLIVAIVLVVLGLRPDYTRLGPEATWGLSFIQLLACLLVFYAMLRSTIPGDSMPLWILASIGLSGMVIHAGVSWISDQWSPNLAEPGHEWRAGLACLSAIIIFALLPFAFGIVWIRAGLPIQARATGILLGLGSGLAAEAAWRLHCPISSWDHVLVSHSGAVLVAMACGLMFGSWWLEKHGSGVKN